MTAKMRLPQPRLDEVIFGTRDPYLVVRARMADAPPTLAGGAGGWELVERARRAPLTVWKAPPAKVVGFTLLLDGWASDTPVVTAVNAMDRMARPRGVNSPPPVVWIAASAPRVPYAPGGWIITALEWAERIVRPFPTRIVRQRFTVELTEYVDEAVLVKRKPKRKPKTKAPKKHVVARPPGTNTTTARAGEHLAAIALRELGDPDRWPEIAALNGVRDPSAVRAGQVIRLP